MTNLEKQKEARRTLRTKLGNIMEPFDMYGLGVYIPPAIRAIIDACEQFCKDMKEE